MTKRYSISVTDWQASALEELAALDEVSVSHVVRDCLRATLPKLLELSRFIHDPATTREETLHLVEDMEALFARMVGEGAEVADGDVATRRRRRPAPPSGNTGVNPA